MFDFLRTYSSVSVAAEPTYQVVIRYDRTVWVPDAIHEHPLYRQRVEALLELDVADTFVVLSTASVSSFFSRQFKLPAKRGHLYVIVRDRGPEPDVVFLIPPTNPVSPRPIKPSHVGLPVRNRLYLFEPSAIYEHRFNARCFQFNADFRPTIGE